MDIPEILEQLRRCRTPFPKQAVAEAIARREEIVPELLGTLERVVANPARYAADEAYFGHIFALFLLAKFRETRAFPLIIRIVTLPGEQAFNLLGDVIHENIGSILASTCGSEDAEIKSLIENPDVDEYVRAAGFDALVALVAAGQRSRDEVMSYFAGLFDRLERKPGYVWSALAGHSADLCPLEVQDRIREAYREGLIDREAIHPDDVRDALKNGIDGALKELPHRNRLVDDVEQEMTWMSGFQERSAPSPAYGDDVGDDEPAEPYQRPGPKVGRNAPCPCGSGKKFKKCCGA